MKLPSTLAPTPPSPQLLNGMLVSNSMKRGWKSKKKKKKTKIPNCDNTLRCLLEAVKDGKKKKKKLIRSCLDNLARNGARVSL